MSSSILWTFAHRALSQQFHRDPRRFVAILDGEGAEGFLESLWLWARGTHGTDGPLQPPVTYTIRRTEDEPRDAMLAMRFRDVRETGEPHAILAVIAEGHHSAPPIYARLFLLEHSDYASELAAATRAPEDGGSPTPRAYGIVCENERDGTHRNTGVVLPHDDDDAFEAAVLDELAR